MMGRWWQVNNKKTALWKIFTAILAAGGLLCLLSGRIFIWPGTFVRGIEIGGNTPSAAIKKLASSLDYADFKITLEIPGRPAEISPAGDLGIKADLKKSVLATRRPLWSVSTRSHYPLVFEIVPGRLKDYLDSLASNVYRQPVDARLIINNDEVQLIPHINGIQLDVEKTLDLLLEEVKWGKRNGNLEAPLIKVQPAVTMETLDSYMPIVAVSTFSTMYQADTDRGFNIELVSSYFKGLVVQPGETISFNGITGPRNQEQGYRKAPVLINDRLVDDWGGGICQVSSTLYVALLKAGWEVVERHSHGIPVSYIPMGLDATIAYDLLDLKMTNSTGVPAIIDVRASLGEIKAKIYGRKGDISIEVESFILKEIPAQTEDAGGDSTNSRRSGFVVETLKYYIKDGQIIKTEKIDTSTYPPEK